MSDSIFKVLSGIDISSMIQKKGQFFYMPWSNAVREITKNYPEFSWEFTSYEGLPYLKTELGYFVECSATIGEQTKKQMMPVLDFKNQTNQSPSASDINKSQMRALAKVISLFGLGLDLWAGEDLVGYDQIDRTEEMKAKSDKFNSLYDEGKPPLVLWGYIDQFKDDEEFSQYIYKNFPKNNKTKVSDMLRDGRVMFFEYKEILESGDEMAIEQAKEELSELELQIINKGIQARN